jgi:rRNA maturation endonuclease Nob1
MSEMVMIENEQMDIVWQCEACKEIFDDTENFEDTDVCPNCGQKITYFVYIEEESGETG